MMVDKKSIATGDLLASADRTSVTVYAGKRNPIVASTDTVDRGPNR